MKRPEQALQISAVSFIRIAWPDLVFWFVPNGGNLSKAQRGQFQRMGLKPGVADLHFMLPGGRLGVIELKSDRGRPSEDQYEFEAACLRHGVLHAYCRSVEQVIETLNGWLEPHGIQPRARLLPSGVTQRLL